MPSVTVENYLKQVYLEQQQVGDDLVPMGRLAAAMDVTPGTATSMVKALADAKLIDYAPRGGVRLTPEGTRLALQVLRRHRLIEQFLVEVLKLDWSEVHDEAEELEHAISDKVLAKIDELLGHPDTDPHGDPIPPATGTPRARTLTSLVDADEGRPLTIARVADQDAAFLQFADRHGLTPGASVTVTGRDPAADAVTVRPVGKRNVTLGLAAAAKILTED
ncbi:metal-dependent transcriptional regulator [Phycisphaerales bacterium AB-hyl4]|uniref:Transcriptional regulator MntR n=1 Tax=Natronomicrosphaera hydrolytica TaxID=3242702 RepID=A0ABV4U3M6_9BACT